MFSGIPVDEEDVKMKEDEVKQAVKADLEDEFDIPMAEASRDSAVVKKFSPEKEQTPFFLNTIEFP